MISEIDLSNFEGDSELENHLILERDVGIAMRDETVLRAEVFRPDGGPRVPCILFRTPYGRLRPDVVSPIDPRQAADRGYALVVLDCRGRGGSGGTMTPYSQEQADGYDSVEWAAAQPWCDGDVVMTGWSYCGATQWLAAASKPPSLRAIAPINSSDSFGEGWSFRNGVRELGLLATWVAGALAPLDVLRLDDPEAAVDDDPTELARLVPEARIWLQAPPEDPYWREISVSARRADVEVPAFCIGGWFDVICEGTIASYRRSTDPRDRLLLGGWGHDNFLSHLVGPRNVGFAGSGPGIELGARILDFFDDVRAGRDPRAAAVVAYVPGRGKWREFSSWPPPGAVADAWPLGAAATFDVDTGDLPPSLGGRGIMVGVPGGGFGPADQRPIAARTDTATFALEVDRPVFMAGPVRLDLAVAAEGGERRQWTAVLARHARDGALDVITEGVAWADTAATSVSIPVGDVCLELDRGERLEVIVAGGSFPRWEPVQTGGSQTVLSDSRLVFHRVPSA